MKSPAIVAALLADSLAITGYGPDDFRCVVSLTTGAVLFE